MEMHFPIYNFTTDPAVKAADIPNYESRCQIIHKTGELMVYVPDDFGLRPVCKLDDLRMVTALLASMLIAALLQQYETTDKVNYNPDWGVRNLLEPGITSARMFELLEEGTSYQLYAAAHMAFMDRLPHSPKIGNSRWQAEALMRLATVGERVMVSTITMLKEPDHRHLASALDFGLTALDVAGHKVTHSDLVRNVVSRLAKAQALIVLDQAKVGV